MSGFRLERTDENVDEIDSLADTLGGRVGLGVLLDDLNRRGRRSWMWARAVHRAWTFDATDRADPRWWPQGVSTSADAGDHEELAGRRVVAVAWYAKKLPGEEVNQGVRITFYDLDARRYRHVLVVVPAMEDGTLALEPLNVHAGGIVWAGQYLHIAATAKGFFTCRLDDLLRVPEDSAGEPHVLGFADDRVASYGYRYVLPVRFAYRAATDEGLERLRYSFMSLDRTSDPPGLVVGEYGLGDKTRRLGRYDLDPDTLLPAAGEDGSVRPLLHEDGVRQMQGAAIARDRWYVTSSRGPLWPGSVYTGLPGRLREHRWATPMGPEDISYWGERDELVSVTEHPRRRWIFTMRRSWFDR